VLDGVRNGWVLMDSTGKTHKIKIHKSVPESGATAGIDTESATETSTGCPMAAARSR